MTMFGVLQKVFVESRARSMSLADLKNRLDSTGNEITRRLAAAADSEVNLHQAKHIIGLERWGQKRLRVALGEPLIIEEYDHYRPDDLKDMLALSDAFFATRQATLALVQELIYAAVPPDRKILHNEMGDITVRAWLYYLENHAYRETRLVRMQKSAQTS